MPNRHSLAVSRGPFHAYFDVACPFPKLEMERKNPYSKFTKLLILCEAQGNRDSERNGLYLIRNPYLSEDFILMGITEYEMAWYMSAE